MSAAADAFEEDTPVDDADVLLVDVDGFEGPLDLLLALARSQKVDLTKISVLALAEQYLVFIDHARKLHLQIAADYLVMAAWLAYLKSRLLLPDPEPMEEPSGEEMAARLAFRLKRLQAMREAAERLSDRDKLGSGFFERGMPEAIASDRTMRWGAELYDLLQSYSALRARQFASFVKVKKRKVIGLQEARDRLMRLIGEDATWMPMDTYLTEFLAKPELRATARASALSASLELVREGKLELTQSSNFAPLYVRRRSASLEAKRA
ncbi:segregation/condensation protein A [Afifella sp. H1R]|uniref:segregation and condensation protein A n=1 Tax=Afifella sp. H1R TaxID=2908841 RepID=UPI001F25B3B8|nr:ScpA family protein [Afifella sp. H1R]MCF1503036.1 segregation/condensation protein A [Afifella sp. H1R]